MAKIAKAEAEYQDSLITYMTISKDANALGFESWVNKTRTQREIEQYKNAAPEAVKQVVNIILNIETLRETNPEQAEANFLALMNSPELSGVAKSLQDFSLAEKNWQRVTEENPDLLRMY